MTLATVYLQFHQSQAGESMSCIMPNSASWIASTNDNLNFWGSLIDDRVNTMNLRPNSTRRGQHLKPNIRSCTNHCIAR